ncbi:hypothetical protein REC12_22685 [Desulfosporosinus sp. PR]|uniref:hypothetical protein n=1 Tax=Candidatus Desulfosporosinus nitrosoreducens TaxID=3401928 RepID=UPI0027EEAAC1|nr:hypothetical protein [Desulfosporosinus sp. PR]MDQ7096406.1 hypothetical protein [Desulfosporosinus sp. PR]
MRYLTLAIAVGIILLFGYWSGRRRRRLEKKKVKKAAQVYPLGKGQRQTKLRRVK